MSFISCNSYKLWYGLSWRNQELKPTASFQSHTKPSYWIDREQKALGKLQRQGHGGWKSIMCLWKEQVETVWWKSGTHRHPQVYSTSLAQSDKLQFFTCFCHSQRSKHQQTLSCLFWSWRFLLSSPGPTPWSWPPLEASRVLSRLPLLQPTNTLSFLGWSFLPVQHNTTVNRQKPTARADQILPLAGLEQRSGDVFVFTYSRTSNGRSLLGLSKNIQYLWFNSSQ